MSFGTSIYIIATHHIGPVRSSAFIFCVPFITIISAHIFIHKPLSINIIFGGILRIISTFLININNYNM